MEPRNRKRLLLAIAGSVPLLAVLFLIAPGRMEPTYHGKTLSQWLEHRGGLPFPNRSDGDQATMAIRAIGTNALPHLLSAIASEPHQLRRLVRVNSQKLPTFIRRNRSFNRWLYTPGLVPHIAVEAFGDLGPIAVPAIPHLLRLIQSTDDHPEKRSRALAALVRIGPDAGPAILGVVSNLSLPSECWMLTPIQQMGHYVELMVPALLPQLQNTNPVVVLGVAELLRKQWIDSKTLVPAIVHCLDDPRSEVRVEAANALMPFGGLAQVALPSLVKALGDTNATVRSAAAAAIRRIDPSVLPEELRNPVTP